jgi:oligosaccharyltransferase complex subunit beta
VLCTCGFVSSRAAQSGNEAFATAITQWTLHERGMLRMRNVVHHLPGEEKHPEMYVINQEIEYSLTVEEFDGSKWLPFLADDLQLDFVMLDPYVRTTLKHDEQGNYLAVFKAPDVYGIFTFSLEYHRQGLTSLVDKQRIVVRPLRHDEYERHIVAAYPYYAAAFSMLGSVSLLTVIFLFHRDK